MIELIIICNTNTKLANTLDMLGWMDYNIIRIEVIPDDFGGTNKYKVVYN